MSSFNAETRELALDIPGAILIDLGGVFRTLLSRAAFIMLCVLGFLGAAILYVVITPPRYTAEATILIDPRQERITSADAVLSGIGSDSAAIASQAEIIRSRELLLPVFEELRLHEDLELSREGLASRILSTVNFQAGDGRIGAEEVFDRFRKRLQVERQGLTYVLEIRFTSTDPDKAARIVNAIVDRYQAYQVAEKSIANTEASAQLGERIEQLQEDVADAEKAIEDFRANHGILVLNGGGTLLRSQIDQLSERVTLATEDARNAETRLSQLTLIEKSVSAVLQTQDVVSSPAMSGLREEYNQRLTLIASLETKFGPRHPTLIAAKTEKENLERLIRAEVARIKSQIVVARDLAKSRVASAEADLSNLRKESNQMNTSDVELRRLERRAEASRLVLEDFLRRWRETDQLEGFQKSDIRVIGRAVAPTSATWPKASLLLSVAGFLGLSIGSGATLLRGKLDRPPPQPAGPNEAQTPIRVREAEGALGDLQSAASSATTDRRQLPVIAHLDERTLSSDLTENIALIRNVLAGISRRQKPHVISCSSLSATAAKRALAFGMARNLSAAGASAAVLDLDESDPSWSSPSAGRRRLSRFLDNGTPLSPQDLLDPTFGVVAVLDDLSRIEPFNADSLRQVVARMGTLCDFIIVNAPSFNHVLFSRDLSRAADYEIFCLRPMEEESAPFHRLMRNLPRDLSAKGAILVKQEGPVFVERRSRGKADGHVPT
jgi:succinoglycan biosynthesis transport protein ExoP